MKEEERPSDGGGGGYSTPFNKAAPAPTLTTLTQSDHEIIRTFLSSVPVGWLDLFGVFRV